MEGGRNQCNQGREGGEEEEMEWRGRWPLECRRRGGGEGGEQGLEGSLPLTSGDEGRGLGEKRSASHPEWALLSACLCCPDVLALCPIDCLRRRSRSDGCHGTSGKEGACPCKLRRFSRRTERCMLSPRRYGNRNKSGTSRLVLPAGGWLEP